jgi:hypothetical protein
MMIIALPLQQKKLFLIVHTDPKVPEHSTLYRDVMENSDWSGT